jgi:hypothetical protein
MIRALSQNTWVHIAIGAALMGSWAVFANRSHGIPERIEAGVVQGALSRVLTGLLKGIADRLRVILSRVLAAAGALVVSAVVLLSVHGLAGTPELAATVAVPLVVSCTYIFVYAYLRRELPHG